MVKSVQHQIVESGDLWRNNENGCTYKVTAAVQGVVHARGAEVYWHGAVADFKEQFTRIPDAKKAERDKERKREQRLKKRRAAQQQTEAVRVMGSAVSARGDM